ncbi:hypothetical protein BGL34_02360 [Fructilactobacillus lindneri]|nr:competence protein CoiA family protein [Fructilactobacillus lindneri]ANZ57991.1 hypothetical protein AYR60_04225 [Fructilactobacillus lindneri]ANZ59261.1 hypothetical protein AYR59_04225 [Fructilactobacillus lindneri]POG98902.1 hypothetical protein BGL31_02950 [Fructilactobacillus lindneri]POH00159.1 hypothetical protein BGL33_06245 [Fructilactobacillus lindneri]POH04290.1 hypothetical protein BGL32_02890 [Fructilactobacillus lindneri]
MLMAYHNHKLVMASEASNKNKYFCPDCGEKLIFKHGLKNTAHFSHQNHSNCVNSEPETEQHLQGKSYLFNDLITFEKGVQVEKYLKPIKQRPDILIKNLAIEFQCSPITNQRLRERIEGYYQIGMVSFWILGSAYLQKRVNSMAVLRFMRYKESVGFYLVFLKVTQKRYLLRYQIHQIDNQIYYSEKLFSNWQELLNYLHNSAGFKTTTPSLLRVTSLIEMNLRSSNHNFIKLQNHCYSNGVSVSGCPLVCHYPRIIPPLFGNNWLNWRIEIILKLNEVTEIPIEELYKAIFLKQTFDYNFPFIKSIEFFYHRAFLDFINVLCKQQFIQIKAGTAVKISEFVWYRDTYAKIKAIKKIKKEVKK